MTNAQQWSTQIQKGNSVTGVGSRSTIHELLEGISAIPITPFNDSGEVDLATLRQLVRGMTSAGLRLIIACGNTAEYASLSATEVRSVTEATIEAAGTATTLVGVGGDLSTAIASARRSTELGAAGVMIHAPSHPYISNEGLLEYYSAVAHSTDGSVVLYVRGREIPTSILEKLVAMENVVGIKYARRDLMGFSRLVQRFGSEVVPVCGLAEAWAPFFWWMGGRGFTSGLVNVAPELSLRLLHALKEDDVQGAREAWRLIQPFEEMRERRDDALNVPAVKEAMVLRGHLRSATVRPPISSLTAQEREELRDIVSRWDLVQ